MDKKIKLFREENICYLKGELEYSYLYLITKVGSIDDPYNLNGLAHLIEHFCLLNCKGGKYNSNYIEHQIQVGGVTNFDQTIYVFKFLNDIKYLDEVIAMLGNILDTSTITDKYIDVSKKEVQEEFVYFENKWNIEKKTIQFITDSIITYIPIGNWDDILSMNIDDIKTFIKNNYINTNLSIILATNLNITDEYKKSLQNILNINSYSSLDKNTYKCPREVKINDEILFLKDKNCDFTKIKMYFRNSHQEICIKKKLIRCLFEILTTHFLEDRIYSNKIKKVYISDKYISNYYYFTSISINIVDNYGSSYDIYNVINKLREKKFEDIDLKYGVNLIKNLFIENNSFNNIDEMLLNILNFYLYKEPIHITKDQYDKLFLILKDIKISDVNDYKDWALSPTCKAILIN